MKKLKWIENTSEEPAPVDVPLFVQIGEDYGVVAVDDNGYLWYECGDGIIGGVSADDIDRYVELANVLESIGGAE